MKKGHAIALNLEDVFDVFGGRKPSNEDDPDVLDQAFYYMEDGTSSLHISILKTLCTEQGEFVVYEGGVAFHGSPLHAKKLTYQAAPSTVENKEILQRLLPQYEERIAAKRENIRRLAIEYYKAHGKYNETKNKLEKSYELFDPNV
ncbi:hypothetical protein [Duganella hordei]|uniref:hypothetical protein n=1 Tax=Duganella hordei TaxID=2865934 RepID=UPI0030E7EDCE